MKIRAAVLEEFAQPLVVQDVELDGPGRVRCWCAWRLRRLSHRPLHGQRRRPLRLRAHRARPRGRRRRRGDRRGRDQRRARRPRGHPVLAPVRRVHPLPVAQDQPLPGDPRAAEPRLPARRHDPPQPRRRAHPPLHGHEHVRRGHRDARDRARQGRPGGPARRRLHARLRRDHRHRRRALHRQGRAGLDLRGVRGRASWAWGPWPAAGWPAPSGSSCSTCPRTGSSTPAPRAPPTRSWAARVGGPGARADRRLRRRLHLRGDRQRRRDAPGGRGGAMGWGCARSPAWPARASCSRWSRAS